MGCRRPPYIKRYSISGLVLTAILLQSSVGRGANAGERMHGHRRIGPTNHHVLANGAARQIACAHVKYIPLVHEAPVRCIGIIDGADGMAVGHICAAAISMLLVPPPSYTPNSNAQAALVRPLASAVAALASAAAAF